MESLDSASAAWLIFTIVSKLPSADCQPPSTPKGLPFNLLEKRSTKNQKNICLTKINTLLRKPNRHY